MEKTEEEIKKVNPKLYVLSYEEFVTDPAVMQLKI